MRLYEWAEVRDERAVLDMGEHRLVVRARRGTRIFVVPEGASKVTLPRV